MLPNDTSPWGAGPHRVWWWSATSVGRSVYWWLTSYVLSPPGAGSAKAPASLPNGALAVAGRMDEGAVGSLLGLLTGALPIRLPGEDDTAAVTRAANGALCSAEGEEDLARCIGALLPEQLRTGLQDAPDTAHTVVIAGAPLLAQVPWDLADLGDGTRLVERARLRAAMTPALFSSSAVKPLPAGPPLVVLDPSREERSVFTGATHHRDLWPDNPIGGPWCTRARLRGELGARPSRVTFFGHIAVAPIGSPHLHALELGDGSLDAGTVFRRPFEWPFPPRVALLGCRGDDAGQREQLGLVAAAMRAGATTLTTTRWPLPTDASTNGATTSLGLAVHGAHGEDDVVDAMRTWALASLRSWRDSPGLETSPLLWSSTITYVAPRGRLSTCELRAAQPSPPPPP